MKQFIFILGATILNSCVYDPPLKGYDVFIENQTNDFIFVTDTLPETGTLNLYDTFSVNNKAYILAKGNYIPKYNKWVYFIPQQKLKETETNHNEVFLYFITSKNLYKSCEEIRKNNLFKIIPLNMEDLMHNSVNSIFYSDDTLYMTHKFNLEKLDKDTIKNGLKNSP